MNRLCSSGRGFRALTALSADHTGQWRRSRRDAATCLFKQRGREDGEDDVKENESSSAGTSAVCLQLDVESQQISIRTSARFNTVFDTSAPPRRFATNPAAISDFYQQSTKITFITNTYDSTRNGPASLGSVVDEDLSQILMPHLCHIPAGEQELPVG
ncbi:hypothetical protein PAMP_001994 [Pampus punctatissimus]